MTGQIQIPIWLLSLLLFVTAWAILDRVFIPSVRWFLRRRVNRVLDEISARLDIEIRPFQLTKRQVLIDRLVYDSTVMEAMQAHAQEHNMPREVAQAEVLSYAKEIVPSFNAYIYFRIGYWLAKKVARLLYWVRVDRVDTEQLASIDPDSTVVFIVNHRSNMDYILVSFLVAEQTALSYAAGEWAKIWPLQTLIRATGAYFVRRDSRNPLYRRVLERYVRMATKEGVCQAVFIEGGLSRDGQLRSPKLGLIDYMLRGFDTETDRDIVFIPVGINYDRTLEDRSLIRTLDPHAEKRSKWFVFKTTVGFIWRNLMLMAFHRWHRFGYACVNFGTPVSARKFCRVHAVKLSKIERDARFSLVKELCNQLMVSIQDIIPVLPVSLVASVLSELRERQLSEFDVKAHVHGLIEQLKAKGAPVLVPRRGAELSITTAFNMLKLRKMVIESDGLFSADPESLDILSYYANAIDHWLHPPAIDIESREAAASP
ncbi:MAG: 1-acyl-sn-glycerol-3-phosphate acyltransferase [Desulfobacterales bacterium]|nr:MAG: 1-acyl-sn-glycerol-3-phosphate acyltransferase [Desulfobacterales bacterium]